MNIQYDIALDAGDISQILMLQKANLASNISAIELASEGFVTVVHDRALLMRMNTPHPHIVARDEGVVIAYALVMLRSFSKDIPVLKDMFERFRVLSYAGIPLDKQRYFVMGQVCVAKPYRGTGVFAGLYDEMSRRMREHFDFTLTQVDETNPRSLRAHLNVGFEILHSYAGQGGRLWHILLLPL